MKKYWNPFVLLVVLCLCGTFLISCAGAPTEYEILVTQGGLYPNPFEWNVASEYGDRTSFRIDETAEQKQEIVLFGKSYSLQYLNTYREPYSDLFIQFYTFRDPPSSNTLIGLEEKTGSVAQLQYFPFPYAEMTKENCQKVFQELNNARFDFSDLEIYQERTEKREGWLDGFCPDEDYNWSYYLKYRQKEQNGFSTGVQLSAKFDSQNKLMHIAMIGPQVKATRQDFSRFSNAKEEAQTFLDSIVAPEGVIILSRELSSSSFFIWDGKLNVKCTAILLYENKNAEEELKRGQELILTFVLKPKE